MFILIPLGGTGERFKKNGYKEPKALIKVLGKPILYYLLDNLNLRSIDFVYIVYNQEYSHYRLEDQLVKDYPLVNFMFLKLDKNTGGAAETIHLALDKLTMEDTSVLCLDGDNFYSVDIVSKWKGMNKVITFTSTSNLYSYVQVNNDNKVTDIIEKQPISPYACSGAYGFNSYKTLWRYSKKVVDNDIKQNGEYYTSAIIKEMICDGTEFQTERINKSSDWTCLGTPIQVRQFCNNYPKFSCVTTNDKIRKMRICFDLDNTLVTFPFIKNDYTSVNPIQKNIDFLRYLKSFGHTIIIYTARRMKTHNGNVGKVTSDIGKLTFETLEKFSIPFDEIYFGKPYADVYIDDLALNCYDDMEKSTGFYIDKVVPRDFNEIVPNNTIETYTKKSSNLCGEIYYYNHVPLTIKDLFPILVDYDDTTARWYTMEKIYGLTMTSLYTSELLTKDMLVHIMNSIHRIHSVQVVLDDVCIYDNYVNKLKLRYNSYDYSQFPNSEYIFSVLVDKLSEYENSGRGIQSIIHGDPVMTNIIINTYDKIKFIDMRGTIGNILSLQGDLMYDWAKLYQSLIGYDCILQGASVSDTYKNEMIRVFENKFIDMYSSEQLAYVKIITGSLLFTLIPLHNNDKCKEYYALISLE
jgi:capsule biosynthesis phosphatase